MHLFQVLWILLFFEVQAQRYLSIPHLLYAAIVLLTALLTFGEQPLIFQYIQLPSSSYVHFHSELVLLEFTELIEA